MKQVSLFLFSISFFAYSLSAQPGKVGIGTTTPDTKLHVVGGTDVGPGSGGFIQTGATNAINIGIDDNEIMARNAGVPGILYINREGGNVLINQTNNPTGKLGVGIANPLEKVDVNGAIRIGNSVSNPSVAGTIRWNAAAQDFEGYTGTEWRSLTKNGLWGRPNSTSYENQIVSGTDTPNGSEFGRSVSISGNYAIIGCTLCEGDQGSAYIYKKNGANWTELATLVAPSGTENSFGWSVHISGDYAIVGAPFANSGLGAAYVFQRTGGDNWTFMQTLTIGGTEAGDTFGGSVAISEGYAFVGAFNYDYGALNDGVVVVFKRSGNSWTSTNVYADFETPNLGANFGSSLATTTIGNDTLLLVGAPGDNDSGFDDSGAVYVYGKSGNSTWELRNKTLSSSIDYRFGSSIATSGTTVAVGAPGAVINGNQDAGLVTIHELEQGYGLSSGFGLSPFFSVITPDDPFTNANFGNSAGISGNDIIVGTSFPAGAKGFGYVFTMDGPNWNQAAKLVYSGFDDGTFGFKVAISGNDILVGAFRGSESGSNDGVACFFSR